MHYFTLPAPAAAKAAYLSLLLITVCLMQVTDVQEACTRKLQDKNGRRARRH